MIFLGLYLKTLYKDARTFRVIILLISFLVSIWRLVVQYAKGIITASLWSTRALFWYLLPSWVHIWASGLFGAIPLTCYFMLFRVVLLLSALFIIIRSLTAIW